VLDSCFKLRSAKNGKMPEQTLADVFDTLYFSATSEQDKGSRFERLLKRYLQVKPKYSDQFSVDALPQLGLKT
jgi:predicted helicase